MDGLKILIPTDFSIQAEYAYVMVKKLEEKIPVEVHFIHVINVPDTVNINKDGTIDTCGEISVEYVLSLKKIAERKLDSLKAVYGSQVITHLVFGKTTDQIVDFAHKNSFDLIVMGTKGAWGWKEIISGTETQMIARLSSVPLLSLRCDRSDLTIKNILLVHDFLNSSNEDLTLLHKLVSKFQTKLHLLQIIQHKAVNNIDGILNKMDQFADMNKFSNYEKNVLSDIDIENGVIHFNQIHEMDLVYIGTHGKGSFFHQSSTEKLINHLFKPIISYHLKN